MTRDTIEPLVAEGATLRSLVRDDLPLTLVWRNDDDSRPWFHSSSRIEWQQHVAWFDAYVAKDDDQVFIVEVDGVPVAQAALYGIRDGGAEFGRLLVAPDSRGRGLGHVAMELCLRAARERFGLDRVHLEVKDANARAIAVYERAQFVPDRDSKATPGSTVWVRKLA